MSWLISSVTATLIATAILSFCYFYLYRHNPQAYLRIWAVSWAMYFFRYVFMLVILMWKNIPILFICNQLSSLFSGLLLLYGSYVFINKKFPRIFYYLAAAGTAWILVGVSLDFDFKLISFPTFGFLSAIYIWIGLIFARLKATYQKESRVVGLAFILWGIHKANYPVLRPIEWFAPWGYLIAAILGLVVALGLLMIYFRKTKDELEAHKNGLLEGQRKLEAVFNSAPSILAIVDKAVRVEMINHKGTRLFNAGKQNQTGNLCGEIFNCMHAQTGDCGKTAACPDCPLRARILSTFETGRPHIEEEGQMTCLVNGEAKGMDFLISTNKLSIDGEDRVLLSMTDISKRKNAEAQILEKHKEIESIFRSAPIGIGVNADRVLRKINPRLEQISGYSEKELFGQNARILYPSKEEYDYVGREKYRQIKVHGTGTVETKWQRKDGKVIDILLSSTPIDLDDYSKGVTFTALDITASKNNENALLESEEKYRTMMESQEDPTYICSADMRIEYMNPAMEKWLGRDATGEVCYEALWGSTQRCPWCFHQSVMEGLSDTTELEVPDSDETYHVSSSPIHHTDGSISKLTSYRNITDIKQLYKKLQQAQKMETIGTLAGGIAHDFNNILFPILGHAELLLEEAAGKDQSDYDSINQIYSSALRAKELVQQILTFSRQEKTVYSPLKVQLILKEALKFLRSTTPKSIEISQFIDPECGLVMADPTQLHQIIMNLTTNACHAMEKDGGHLRVELRQVRLPKIDATPLPPGEYACLTVSDTGVGIPATIMEKIFEPYFTTKEKGKGTGLGLSVVHGIVEKMQGRISLKTYGEKGTQFEVCLPIYEKKENPSHLSPSIGALPTGSERILLVDDEAPVTTILQEILSRLGYSVSKHTSSKEALMDFKETPEVYDLVISDLSMPQMTGDKLASEILAIRGDIPIIICTGFSEHIDEETAQSLGIKGFLMKPLVKDAIANEIRRVLDQHGKAAKTVPAR